MARKADAAALAGTISGRIAARPGATIPELRLLRRAISRELRGAPAALVMEGAVLLSQGDRRGHRFVAYELVKHHAACAAGLGVRALERLGKGMSSWDEVDCFSLYLSGPAWQRGQISDGTVHGWAHSGDVWWRRTAVVSTVPLNSRTHGGRGDAPRTLRVCRMLEADRDPMVVKAVSWALRVLAGREPSAVRAFLEARRRKLAALVLRETRNKLETGLKNPGKRR